jgi:hypothetical protein
VLGSPCQLCCFIEGLEFGFGLLADRALPIVREIRKFYAFFLLVIDVTADRTFEFHSVTPFQ